MREIFVSELVREILGPRHGIRETLTESPLNEYVTGVLAPRDGGPTSSIDEEAVLPVEGNGDVNEDDLDTDGVEPALASPALTPQARPHSIGLTFAVEADAGSSLSFCMTWARYDREENVWTRMPRHAVLTNVPLVSKDYFIDADGATTSSDNSAEISLRIIVRPEEGRFLISAYLVNEIPSDSPQSYPSADTHIFQPQIRVVCNGEASVVPEFEGTAIDEEERELRFLYRNRQILAKGHLCSAVWKEIDIERLDKDDETSVDFPESLGSQPFTWLDGQLLSEGLVKRFSPPDVRTEFVPLYSIESPDIEWTTDFGPAPETRSDRLAECWDASALREALEPLVNGYSHWINDLKATQAELAGTDHDIAERLIEKCEHASMRLRKGIDLLIENDDARLSFCFAMRAIAVQSQWPITEERPPIEWYPFQLAFILLCLESIADPDSTERDVCDLLWVPTGAGKTEAYLALAAFTLAYRRRRALSREEGDRTGAGVAVISRYTLRLLTIQQFRRTLKMVTACEVLRVEGLGSEDPVGWRPQQCGLPDDYIWGSSRFSAGLWVGGSVTPNYLSSRGFGPTYKPGAVDLLQGAQDEGDPAQVMNCPVCDGLLSVASYEEGGLSAGNHTLHLVVRGSLPDEVPDEQFGNEAVKVESITVYRHREQGVRTISVNIRCEQTVGSEAVDRWWREVERDIGDVELLSARASRPGYFIRDYFGAGGSDRARAKPYDFDIFCPNPECSLTRFWGEGKPHGSLCRQLADGDQIGPRGFEEIPTLKDSGWRIPSTPDGNRYAHVQTPFCVFSWYVADRIPIPAFTTDEQVYNHVPSVVVSTADKFARLAFEPRAGSLFGNVDHHHCLAGYYRRNSYRGEMNKEGHPQPVGNSEARLYTDVEPLNPPDLVLQDELHLIEGPLGSLTGFYETAFDYLCREVSNRKIKYIASTATVQRAEDQVRSLFDRRVTQFPPHGLTVDDRFFVRFPDSSPLDDDRPGRLYVGVAAPGRGPLEPIQRIWARLMQTTWDKRDHDKIDPYWTLTGYFNAIGDLGGVTALYRQDIPERIERIAPRDPRPLQEDRQQELSSRVSSTKLPYVLNQLETPVPNAQDALFTTSMFGTGVDISRISMMMVYGQPKNTASYIQATGRVGRQRGAVVLTFFRASRPRDLNHYEYFSGYHSQLQRSVEPITVVPFASGVLQRACGPLVAYILRNMRNTSLPWHPYEAAIEMRNHRLSEEVQRIPELLESRAQHQPDARRPDPGEVRQHVESALHDWESKANLNDDLQYVEYAIESEPKYPVVLGDPQHQHKESLDVVYENAPQSLRDIEETCGFQTK